MAFTREIAALRRSGAGGHGVAQHVEELERQSLAEAPLRFELDAGEVGVAELAVDANVAEDGLIVRAARGIGVGAGGQRQVRCWHTRRSC